MARQKDRLAGKKVLIVGFGRQGQALARWLPNIGASAIVNDNRTAEQLKVNTRDYPDVHFVLGEHPETILRDVDLLCVSGGVSLDLPLIQLAVERNIPLSNDAQLFMERCPAPVIGITGSSGKTTTTTLVGEILKRAGYTTWVGGNIGDVLLDILDDVKPDHRVVIELSSFQLELMSISPQVAAILNITPNHLDRHETMENYIRAKANIILHQRVGDVAILSYDDPGSRSLEALPPGELVWFSANQLVSDGAFMAGNRIIVGGAASYDYVPHVVCEKTDIPLRGEHNVSNVLAACAIAGSVGLAADSPGIAPEIMHETIVNFKAVPHRLEIVRELAGVVYVNDSIATAPERLAAALNSFDETLVLLLGGADKDLPWQDILLLALRKSRHLILFGKFGQKQVADKVLELLKKLGVKSESFTRVRSLDEAVQKAREVAQSGDVVLLSPGGTSYDAYKDFEERGEHFRRLVSAL